MKEQDQRGRRLDVSRVGVGGYFVTREATVGCEGCAGLRENVTTAGTDIRWHYSDETARCVAYFMQSVYAPSPWQASLSMRRKIS